MGHIMMEMGHHICYYMSADCLRKVELGRGDGGRGRSERKKTFTGQDPWEERSAGEGAGPVLLGPFPTSER